MKTTHMASESPEKKKCRISTELATFDVIFPELVKELTDDVVNPEIQDAVTWFREVLIIYYVDLINCDYQLEG